MNQHFDKNRILLEPYDYLISNSGKQFRNKLIESFNFWLNITNDEMLLIQDIINLLHNSSLLIDDIEDDSVLRRGIPVAHHVFGLGLTINCANYCYFLALDKLINEFPEEKVLKGVKIFTKQMLELHEGQGLDIYWRDNYICPTEQQYLKMINQKTGGLFGLALHLMKLFSDCKYDFNQLLISLGQYFQIRDDYANLLSNEYKENKSFAEDLTEGKYSFPVIHAIQNNPMDSTIQEIIKKKTNDINLKEFAIKKMKSFGSFDYTMNRIKELDSEVEHQIQSLGGNSMLSKLLDVLRKV